MPTTPRGYPYPDPSENIYDPVDLQQLAETIDSDVGGQATAVSRLDAEAARISDDETVSGSWTFTGPLWISEPFLDLRARGVRTNGRGDQTALLQKAIDDVAAAHGQVFIPPTGSDFIRCEGPLILPKTPGWGIRGVERTGSRLKFVGLGASSPAIRWDTRTRGSVEHQTLESFRIERNDDGTLIEFTPSTKDDGSANDDRWKARLKNLTIVCARPRPGEQRTGVLVNIERALKGQLENIWLYGGGLGIRLYYGSHVYMRDLYVPSKASPTDLIKIERGGSHTLIAARSEGSTQEGVSFDLLDCRNTTIVDAKTEGHREAAVFRIKNCVGIVVVNPTVAVPEKTTATAPRGICVINSKAVRVIGGYAGHFNSPRFPEGLALEIDANCRDVGVDGLILAGNDHASTEILNKGTDSWVLAYNLLPSRHHAAFTPFSFGQMSGGGIVARHATARFGTLSDDPVELVQDDNVRIRIGPNEVELLQRLRASPSTPEGAGLGVPHGVPPSSPVDGDLWTTDEGLFVRINGVNRQVNLT